MPVPFNAYELWSKTQFPLHVDDLPIFEDNPYPKLMFGQHLLHLTLLPINSVNVLCIVNDAVRRVWVSIEVDLAITKSI